MLKARDLLTRVAGTTPFNATLTWYVNGEKGYLHLDRQCDKRSKQRTPNIRELTLADALRAHTLCDTCPQRSIWYQTDASQIITDVQNLAEVDERLLAGYHPADFTQTAHPAIWRAGKNIWVTGLFELLGERDALDPGLTGWWDQLNARITAETVTEPTRKEFDDDALNWSSIRLHIDGLENVLTAIHDRLDDHQLWDEQAQRMFLRPNRQQVRYPDHTKRHPIGALYRAWQTALETTGNPDTARRIVTEPETVRDILGPVPLEALDALVIQPLGDAETVGQYAQNLWERQGGAELRRIVDMWHRHVSRLSEPSDAALTPWWGERSDVNGANLVLSVWIGDRRDVATKAGNIIGKNVDHIRQHNGGVAITHPSVARALSEIGLFGRWNHQTVNVTVVPDRDVLETAVTLWEPNQREGSYTLFGDALAAANRL